LETQKRTLIFKLENGAFAGKAVNSVGFFGDSLSPLETRKRGQVLVTIWE